MCAGSCDLKKKEPIPVEYVSEIAELYLMAHMLAMYDSAAHGYVALHFHMLRLYVHLSKIF